MERDFFLKTDRIGFSKWTRGDLNLARQLWGDPEVTRYICASGSFTEEDVKNRLNTEIANDADFGVQYWPIFSLASGELIGCCGLRPYEEEDYELGFHLRPRFWRQGYGVEAANAAIRYAFTAGQKQRLFAGHNPKNIASKKVLSKLGFSCIGEEFYAPTGLYHPLYELNKPI